jgi:hypothetical protein
MPPPTRLPAAAAAVRRALQGLLVHRRLLVLVVASFWSLDLQWAQFLSLDAARSMGRFLGEFFPPDTQPDFLRKVAMGTWETLAMSALGTVLAAPPAWLLALPASRLHEGDPRPGAHADAAAAQRAALHPRAGVGRAAADRRRPGAVCRHAGAGHAHHRRAGPAVCRSASKTPRPARRGAARPGRGHGRCSCTPRCRRCCRN